MSVVKFDGFLVLPIPYRQHRTHGTDMSIRFSSGNREGRGHRRFLPAPGLGALKMRLMATKIAGAVQRMVANVREQR